jgi:citrate lyase beta subunit
MDCRERKSHRAYLDTPAASNPFLACPTLAPATARSLLFVPADHGRRLARAWTAPSDAVIADLEDAVAPAARPAARELLEAQIGSGRPRGALVVRINALDTEDSTADLALLRRCFGIDAIVVPKASARTLATLNLDIPVIALVETAAGILGAADIARVPGVFRLMLGTVDLAAELGIAITPTSPVFQHARAALTLASAAARLPGPIDGVWTAIGDTNGLSTEALNAKSAGFTGKACIHPDQLSTVHETFSPSPDELEQARRIVDAAGAALAAGQGAIAVEGLMVDRPVVERARQLLADAQLRT